jgi:hypothetical protein
MLYRDAAAAWRKAHDNVNHVQLEANEPEEMRHKKNVLIGRRKREYTCHGTSGCGIPVLPLLGADDKGLRKDGRVWMDRHQQSCPQDGVYFKKGKSDSVYKMYEKKK